MVRDLTSFLYNYNATYDRAKDWIYENPPKHFPFFFEVADLVWWQNVMVDYWQFPFVVCVVYLTTVFGMEGWMRGRTPFKLKRFLVCWNVTMALLNLFGFVRQMQELVPILAKPDGFHRSLCIREELNLPTGTPSRNTDGGFPKLTCFFYSCSILGTFLLPLKVFIFG